MVILPNTFYFRNYDDFNQQDQCHQQYQPGHNQYNSLLDIQFHHHCLFNNAFLKPSASLIKGWTFEISFGSVSVKIPNPNFLKYFENYYQQIKKYQMSWKSEYYKSKYHQIPRNTYKY